MAASLVLLQKSIQSSADSLAAISYFTEDIKATIVISTMVVLSTFIRFIQESRSNNAADKLKDMVSNTATVLRRDPAQDAAEESRQYFHVAMHPKGPRKAEVAIKLLVPGDLVLLSAGDMIPADLRVLAAKDLFVSQAAMTGESMPVEKFSVQRIADVRNPSSLITFCLWVRMLSADLPPRWWLSPVAIPILAHWPSV